jgi:hypothetical protein
VGIFSRRKLSFRKTLQKRGHAFSKLIEKCQLHITCASGYRRIKIQKLLNNPKLGKSCE